MEDERAPEQEGVLKSRRLKSTQKLLCILLQPFQVGQISIQKLCKTYAKILQIRFGSMARMRRGKIDFEGFGDGLADNQKFSVDCHRMRSKYASNILYGRLTSSNR